jgi:hypothetical protein
MPLIRSQAGSRSPKRTALQRMLAALLLFLFVQDIGFHIAVAFFIPPEGPAQAVLLGGHGFPDTDGYGIPDDDDQTPFHHHHYPAVVTQGPNPVPLVAIARLIESLPVETVRCSIVPPTGRAPPLA